MPALSDLTFRIEADGKALRARRAPGAEPIDAASLYALTNSASATILKMRAQVLNQLTLRTREKRMN